MFSGLSKLADKSFILGYFIPALFGLAAVVVSNQDIPLFHQWLESAGQAEKGLGNVIATLFIIWAAAVFLMIMNLHIFKIFEGYYWPFNTKFFRQRQIDRSRERWKPYHDDVAELQELTREIADLAGQDLNIGDNAERLAKKRARAIIVRLRANKSLGDVSREYLKDEQYILGTRLGNVIRCFENYPANMYDASSIVIWPRMADVVSKEYMEVISEARAEVDMYLSFTVVLLGLALFSISRSLVPCVFGVAAPSPWVLAVTLLATLLLANGCYLLAVRSAKSWWGETYKSAYDLYLDALAKKLGYTLPADPTKRREFWRMISNRFRYLSHADLSDLRTAISDAEESAGGGRKRESGKRGAEGDGDEDDNNDNDEDEAGAG
jgi:hypothetical protein